ncbi:MAG: response regulator transcription factor [Ignavibacteriales bacterium]|nr:response regulator transcription factor [Ignavibacteriales bacterium]
MHSPQNKNCRIPVWIIDDNKEFCFILSEALNLSGTVECQKRFHSCKSALQALTTEDSPPSVILLDIKMPKMSGLDAITSIKSVTSATQIIMLTSYDLDENIRTAMNRGASGYLLKSCTPVEIINAIEKAQKGDSPVDPMITKRVMDAFLLQSSENRYFLTSREKDILQCLASDLTVQDVASKLNLSYFTVDTHIKNIYQKLNVHNRQGLVTKASKERLI